METVVSVVKSIFRSPGVVFAVASAAGLGVLLARADGLDGVVVADKERYERKRRAIIEGGHSKLQIVADFDRTLTALTVNGKPGCTCHGVAEVYPKLSPAYRAGTGGLLRKYYPIEKDPAIPRSQKIPLMVEWYTTAHAYLLREHFYRSDVCAAVANANMGFRQGAEMLIRRAVHRSVPFLIFSAGIGDIIEEFVARQIGALPENVHVLSNRIEFNEQGRAIAFSAPLIHMFNKNDSHVRQTQWHQAAEGRRNVILLGDSLGDVDMVEEDRYDCVLKVGFLNNPKDQRALLQKYKEAYDVVILQDGSMDEVHKILDQIAKPEAD